MPCDLGARAPRGAGPPAAERPGVAQIDPARSVGRPRRGECSADTGRPISRPANTGNANRARTNNRLAESRVPLGGRPGSPSIGIPSRIGVPSDTPPDGGMDAGGTGTRGPPVPGPSSKVREAGNANRPAVDASAALVACPHVVDSLGGCVVRSRRRPSNQACNSTRSGPCAGYRASPRRGGRMSNSPLTGSADNETR